MLYSIVYINDSQHNDLSIASHLELCGEFHFMLQARRASKARRTCRLVMLEVIFYDGEYSLGNQGILD